MESHTLEQHIKTVATSYKNLKPNIINTPTPPKKPASHLNDSLSDSSVYSNIFTTPDQTFNTGPCHDETLVHSIADLNVTNDTLRTQLNLYQQHNDQLTEQKMKLSQQLGVQTQVYLNSFYSLIMQCCVVY